MLRRASGEDSLGLGTVYCFSWKEAYKDIVPESFLNSLTVENSAPKPEHISPNNNFVIEETGTIVGLVNFGKCRDASTNNVGEIRSIYVLPEMWRRGLGQQLFTAAKEEMKRTGFGGFCLWVLKENAAARQFYKKMGMTDTGIEKGINIAGKELKELKYEFIFR
ncbi:MAG: GNAT family N-acetyltransferase [Clostridiaceae bacterium]|nr:GNAT family N-acetyltransferase [Clostridiaceae bacterium]